ncbi:MAG TPA: glycoside hydrolase family 18 protein [Symbiobacteriaceae bacterium]|nr:glycoside hydrolase family 18 protein [Symbiobacteriaceae bacterium]
MQIHVVQPGQSLWTIAKGYGLTPQTIIAANELQNAESMVPGQALVIPLVGQYHWVQPGESIWQIAKRYGIPTDRLLAINRIADPRQVPVGLRLYIPPGRRPSLESNAYIEPKGQAAEGTAMAEVSPSLTYATMFPYRLSRAGDVMPLRDEYARQGALSGGAAPMMGLTNIEQDQFSTELGEAILGSEELQNTVLTNVLTVMRDKGFRALNIDFEHLHPKDREAYNNFLRKAAQRMHEAGYLLSTALAPKVSGEQVGEWYEAHDYPSHGEIADFSVLMTYEWGWSGGPPMAVAPIDQVERVIRYATSVMPAKKIMMGVPLYGYDWTLPYVEGGPFAKVVSPQDAIALAIRRGVDIQYDAKSQSPFFHYWDEAGKEHVVWFEDARSIQAKFDLVKRYGLRGVSYWKLPLEFPQNWLLLTDNFTVKQL